MLPMNTSGEFSGTSRTPSTKSKSYEKPSFRYTQSLYHCYFSAERLPSCLAGATLLLKHCEFIPRFIWGHPFRPIPQWPFTLGPGTDSRESFYELRYGKPAGEFGIVQQTNNGDAVARPVTTASKTRPTSHQKILTKR